MPIAAVITADIVHSTKMLPNQQRSTVSRFGRILSGHVFEFYRGDSLQAFIRNPNEALELVFQMRAAARSLSAIHDVRASIGIGQASARTTNTRTATSQPYVLSGRGFDQLSGEQRLRIQSPNDQANIAFKVIAQYADHIFRDLTIKQAEVVGKLLEEKTQTEVARSLKKAQATVNKHAQAASWDAIEELIYEYKDAIKQFKLE